MVVKFEKSFDKDMSKVNSNKLALQVKNAILEIESSKKLFDISELKKLKGHKYAYRLKI